ncbi:hypothetical protein [Rodentibacter pneumotropicus]|uniref:hypothetical protein n=1 Tax=Rodentibacter pneumotropicus TaxID=758 RepID=UPI0013622DAB|nr:hypothetical protein [Rodentibacter pneumotropicus]
MKGDQIKVKVWGSNNICIKKKKKFGSKKFGGGLCSGALVVFDGNFMQKIKMVGIG